MSEFLINEWINYRLAEDLVVLALAPGLYVDPETTRVFGVC